MKTVSGGLPAGAVSGAVSGRCAETDASGNSSKANDVSSAALFMMMKKIGKIGTIGNMKIGRAWTVRELGEVG